MAVNNLDVSTPVVWYPGQTEAEFLEEITDMISRTNATQDFLTGKLDADAFLDFLVEDGYNVFDLDETCWNIPLLA
ncbi:hypothetical protein [Calothrix sp. CCY 0018]|uniref:hypothetical protein n=1 Tax=Calothrix sp. CCY 0018 TaxID=3103864 RepID=UPI0039C73675